MRETPQIDIQYSFFNKDAFRDTGTPFRLDAFRDMGILRKAKKQFYFLDKVFIKDIEPKPDTFYYELVASGVIEGVRLSGSVASFHRDALEERIELISLSIRDYYQYLINNQADENFEHSVWSQVNFRLAEKYGKLVNFNYGLFSETYSEARDKNKTMMEVFEECMKWAESFEFKETA